MARHRPHLLVRLPVEGAVIEVDGETRHHLEKVLRYPDGGEVDYTDGAGLVGTGVWRGDVVVRGGERHVPGHSGLIAAVAPPHDATRTRFLVEKLGELGIDRLLWLRTVYGQGRPPRAEKAGAWARAALEQSRGAWLMQVGGPVSIDELDQWGTPVFAEPGGEEAPGLAGIEAPVLCVGPEGGFDPGEIPVGAARLHLGETLLRVETAAIVGVALLRSVRRWPASTDG